MSHEHDEHEDHYAWEVEPFDPEGPLGIMISMSDVECGQILDVNTVILANGDSDEEIEWARSTAEEIAGRLNSIATLTAERDKQAAQFQRETLRTSELSILLKKVYDSMVLRGPLQNQIGALLNRPLPPLVALRCACTVEHEGTNIENWVMKLDCPVHKGIIEWARECAESATKGFEYAEEFRKERDALRTALEKVLRDSCDGWHEAAREALGGKS